MSADLALRRSEVPAEFTAQMQMARVLADSDLLPRHLHGKPANVLVILQGARALDVAAFWALQSMHVIEGKLAMSAELMRGLVIRAGHRITIVERSTRRAVVEIQRSDRDQPYRAEFSIEDAKAAELLTKPNWKRYPKSMMVARATSIAVRDEAPDVLFGVVYTPDELGAVTDQDGNPESIDGEIVPEPDRDQLDGWGTAVLNVSIEELPALWAEIQSRGAALLSPPSAGDDSLHDLLIKRLGREIDQAACADHARAIWRLANQLGIENPPVVLHNADGEVWREALLRDVLSELGRTLPDCDPAAAPAEPASEPDGPEVDGEHAETLRKAAAASWGDETPVEGEIV